MHIYINIIDRRWLQHSSQEKPFSHTYNPPSMPSPFFFKFLASSTLHYSSHKWSSWGLQHILWCDSTLFCWQGRDEICLMEDDWWSLGSLLKGWHCADVPRQMCKERLPLETMDSVCRTTACFYGWMNNHDHIYII